MQCLWSLRNGNSEEGAWSQSLQLKLQLPCEHAMLHYSRVWPGLDFLGKFSIEL